MDAEQARVIVWAVEQLPESTPIGGAAEQHLISLAAEHDATALKVLGRRVFEVVDPEAAEREEGQPSPCA